MSLGFEQAGFDVKAAVEIDPIHCAVHSFNFPDCVMIPKSVADLSGEEIREAIGGGEVNLVFGGAPCQGFSMIGKRVLDDPRNSLVRDFVRIVRELDADCFVFENVKGLTVGRHRKFLEELYSEFGAAGYSVQDPWRVLNAADFGVPQSRERLILMGAKKGHPLPVYPENTHTRSIHSPDLLVPTCPTCADALGDIPNAEDFTTLESQDFVRIGQWNEPGAYAREMRCLDPMGWHFGYRRQWDPKILTSSIRTNHTAISRRRFAETVPGTVEPISRFFRLAPDGVSNTLRAGTDGARGAFTSPRPIHYRHARCITVREMARLHGFPDWFRLHATKWHGARQVGNAVPPALARVIGGAVAKAMGYDPVLPQEIKELGSPQLLTMDLSAASRFWNVAKPASRRDRKSGAKKRKQIDIEAERVSAKV